MAALAWIVGGVVFAVGLVIFFLALAGAWIEMQAGREVN